MGFFSFMSEQIIQTQSFYNSSDITLTLKFQESSGQSHFVINNHSISLKIEHTKSLFQLQGSGSIFLQKARKKISTLSSLQSKIFRAKYRAYPRYTKKWRFIYRTSSFHCRPKKRHEPTKSISCTKKNCRN